MSLVMMIIRHIRDGVFPFIFEDIVNPNSAYYVRGDKSKRHFELNARNLRKIYELVYDEPYWNRFEAIILSGYGFPCLDNIREFPWKAEYLELKRGFCIPEELPQLPPQGQLPASTFH